MIAGTSPTRGERVLSKLGQRLTYANLMSTVAVFIALGGSSYAAVRLSANSVHSRQIAAGAVKSSEIARSAVESSEVRNGSLKGVDFARLPVGQRGDKGTVGARGSRGPQGERGATGPHGPAGADAATNLLVRKAVPVDVAAGSSITLDAQCNPGERAVSGGVSLQPTASASFTQVTSSHPLPNTAGSTPTAWSVGVHNQAANPGSVLFQPYAVCISP